MLPLPNDQEYANPANALTPVLANSDNPMVAAMAMNTLAGGGADGLNMLALSSMMRGGSYQGPASNGLGNYISAAAPAEGISQQGTGRSYAPSGDVAAGILETAQALDMDPVDLATIISYETGGTFDPTKRGPTTQWGQHRGLIQFGVPQAERYGVDWNNPVGSQLGPDGAVAKYFRANGYKPGMGILDAYSIVNAGGPGLYNRSDANNGGAPGTVRDKVLNQMHGHRRNALKLLGL